MAASINSGGAALAPSLFPSSTAWFSSGVAMLASLVFHTAALIAFALVTLGGDAEKDSSLGDGAMLADVAIGTLAIERLTAQPFDRLDEGAFGARTGGDEEWLDESTEIFAEVRGPLTSEFAVDELASPLAAGGGSREASASAEFATTSVATGGGRFDGQATFMGVQAVGERFCIVADRSGSMFGSKFEFLKAEVMRTVKDMSPSARLQLVFFSERALPYPKTEWLQPAKERLAIETWLQGVIADGDTYPRPALNLAFAFDPPPDAIFFMTDGQFDPQVVYQLRRLQRVAQHKVKIHTITFVDRSSEGMMRMIAAENGGTYRHVDEVGDLDR